MQTSQTEQDKRKVTANLYETDFYAWTQKQAEFLHDRAWSHLDLANLIEEIESLGRQERDQLRNRVSILIGNLLKWEYQSNRRSRSLLMMIRISRRDTHYLVKENPSLKPYLQEALQKIYENGRDLAAGETNLPIKTFPPDCCYSLEEILRDRFYPGETAADDLME
jgi:Domain of unknown function DUF29